MTIEEIKALLIPLALALRAEFDGPTQRAYQRILQHVSPQVGALAVQVLEQAGLRFFPTAPEIQAAAEKVRRGLLAAHPYEGCIDCEGHIGYRTIGTQGGQETVERCPCKARHLQHLTRMGIGEPITALPGEAGVGENEPIYPTLEQLPAVVRRQIEAVAARKVLK